MARADEVFVGATLTVEGDRQDYGEDRFITIGFLDATMVVLVWTPRDGCAPDFRTGRSRPTPAGG